MRFVEEHSFGRADPPCEQAGMAVFAQSFVAEEIRVAGHNNCSRTKFALDHNRTGATRVNGLPGVRQVGENGDGVPFEKIRERQLALVFDAGCFVSSIAARQQWDISKIQAPALLK